MKFIFPPRPRLTIPPNDLGRYETGEWIAQPKYNGSRILIQITVDKKVFFWNRHGGIHKIYNAPLSVVNTFASMLIDGEIWLDGELLNKTKSVNTKHKFVLYDILVFNSIYLFGKPDQVDRFELLRKICGNPVELEKVCGGKLGFVVSEDIFLSHIFESEFLDHFNSYSDFDEVEGLVLRKKNSVIANFGNKEYDCNWLIRCRRSNKNCEF
jgi:ATP-dependent DNA ligase